MEKEKKKKVKKIAKWTVIGLSITGVAYWLGKKLCDYNAHLVDRNNDLKRKKDLDLEIKKELAYSNFDNTKQHLKRALALNMARDSSTKPGDGIDWENELIKAEEAVLKEG